LAIITLLGKGNSHTKSNSLLKMHPSAQDQLAIYDLIKILLDLTNIAFKLIWLAEGEPNITKVQLFNYE
jgi:hypothetical protein